MRNFEDRIARGPHPSAAAMIARASAAVEPPIEEMPPAEVRRASDARVIGAGLPREEMRSVTDIDMPGPGGPLRLRVYRPTETGALPFVMFFHGGGFMMGSLDSHDALCRAIAARAGVAVVAVGFRLAPEDPFPAAPDDCLAATRWVLGHAASLDLDATRFAVAGESSGGNLAAGVALRLRDEGDARPRLQALLYPLVDMALDHASYRAFGEGYLLTTARSHFYVDQYLAGHDATDPLVSPLRDPEPGNTVPTFILTAGLDPTVGPALDYADRLERAGVPVERVAFERWTHGFLFWGDEEGSLAAIARTGDALAAALDAHRIVDHDGA